MNNPFLRRDIVGTLNITDGAVRSHYNPDGGMIYNDLPGPYFGRLFEGYLIVKPGSSYHTRLFILFVTQCPFNCIPHTVNQTSLKAQALLRGYFDGFVGDEFGFGGCDGFPSTTLGKFIYSPFPIIYVLDIGDDHELHETLDKG